MKRHPDGYGFLIPDDESLPDLYIAKHDMTGVMTSDRIEAIARRDGRRFRGDKVKVLERSVKVVTGRVHLASKDRGFMVDESFGWGEDLKLSWRPDLMVKEGLFVLARITSYPESPRGFQAEVEHLIGDIGDATTDNLRMLGEFEIPFGFSEEALKEAKVFSPEVGAKDLRGRKDIQDIPFVTIDGATAKDFDDAIWVGKIPTGFHLLVGIADVSHYVKPGSCIDKEAYNKGNSTYFPNFVSPMLPEILSNELCSLRPQTPRLALVADMKLNHQGEMTTFDFYEAVIKSHARVTYGEAQECLDGATPEQHRAVENEIRLAGELAQILLRKRTKEGSLNLDLQQVLIEVDEAGEAVDVLKDERLFAHRLIEELMLMANVAVAKFLEKHQVDTLFRVHEEPKLEALELLEQYLMNFGLRSKLAGSSLQRKISKALEQFSGTPQQEILNILTLRSMKQAKYTPENLGHFGLAFSHYSHFTSPIRRYPDLIVHRLVKSVILSHKSYARMSRDDLMTAGNWLSACEQRSVKAERKIQAVKKARLLSRHLGEEFDGFVSSVAKFGAFVVLRKYNVDGLIKIEDLGFDSFEFKEDLMTLVGRNSGLQFRLGDPVRVQVAAADIESGRIDFVLASGEDIDYGSKSKKSSSSEKRGSDKGHRGSVRKTRVSGSGREDQTKTGRSGRPRSRRHK